MSSYRLFVFIAHVYGVLRELPRENVESLTLEQFYEKYAKPMEPVILQYPHAQRDWLAVREWDQQYLLKKCPDAKISAMRFVDSFQMWAGLTTEHSEMSFEDLFANWAHSQNSSSSLLYGFDFNIKCECPDLLKDFELLKYFLNNPLVVDPQMLPDYLWPALMMGAAGTLSGFHFDNSYLPFWMTVVQGRKRFRVVSYSNWSRHLNHFVRDAGKLQRKIPVFDDYFLENTPEFTDVTVWTGDLAPGDTVYVPVAAGHGALNLESPDMKPAIAVTSNFLDERHEKQIKKLFCKAYQNNKRVEPPAMRQHHCLRLMGVIDGPFNSHRRRQSQPSDLVAPTAPFLQTFLSDDFCTKNARPGQCSKLRSICDEHGYARKPSVGPCEFDTPMVNFTRVDISGNGYVSLEELSTLAVFSFPAPSTFAELKANVHSGVVPGFKRHDVDGDGRLSCIEFFGFAREVMGAEL